MLDYTAGPLGDVTYFSSSRTPWNHISVSSYKIDYGELLQRLSSIESYPILPKNMAALQSDVTSN